MSTHGNSTQHTPGPWHAKRGADNEPPPLGSDVWGSITTPCEVGDDWYIARVWQTGEYLDGEANARLIAAAPDLLAALKAVLPLAEQYLGKAPGHPDNGKLADARDAIAKATGTD